jgi:hypothetical protein
VKNTKSLTLKAEISYALSIHGFDLQNLRGQGYDGASNTRGQLNGLQALFLKVCPCAYYIHCYAHRLQLALVAAARDIVLVTQFFFRICSLFLTQLTHQQSVMMSFMMHKWFNLQGCWLLMILRGCWLLMILRLVKEQIKSAQ